MTASSSRGCRASASLSTCNLIPVPFVLRWKNGLTTHRRPVRVFTSTLNTTVGGMSDGSPRLGRGRENPSLSREIRPGLFTRWVPPPPPPPSSRHALRQPCQRVRVSTEYDLSVPQETLRGPYDVGTDLEVLRPSQHGVEPVTVSTPCHTFFSRRAQIPGVRLSTERAYAFTSS